MPRRRAVGVRAPPPGRRLAYWWSGGRGGARECGVLWRTGDTEDDSARQVRRGARRAWFGGAARSASAPDGGGDGGSAGDICGDGGGGAAGAARRASPISWGRQRDLRTSLALLEELSEMDSAARHGIDLCGDPRQLADAYLPSLPPRSPPPPPSPSARRRPRRPGTGRRRASARQRARTGGAAIGLATKRSSSGSGRRPPCPGRPRSRGGSSVSSRRSAPRSISPARRWLERRRRRPSTRRLTERAPEPAAANRPAPADHARPPQSGAATGVGTLACPEASSSPPPARRGGSGGRW